MNLAAAFHATALAQADRPALRYGGMTLSHGKLDAEASSFAEVLREHGVGLGSPVAIIARKHPRTVVAMLAIWKAGGYYVPLDPAHPPERMRAILADAGIAHLIAPVAAVSAASGGSAWFQGVDVIAPPEAAETTEAAIGAAGAKEAVAGGGLDEGHVAYCLYTSGSTGKPKGVQITHGNVLHFLGAMNRYLGIDAGSRGLNTSPFFFDVFVADVLLPLSVGACVILTGDRFSPPAVLHLLREHAITHFCAVSSLLNLMADAMGPEDRFPDLRCAMTGAEVVNVATISKWLEHAPQSEWVNGYGPTEATCVCLAHVMRKSDQPFPRAFPIGIPLEGMEAMLLEPEGTEAAQASVPSGTIQGELAVSGPQVMKGYLGNDQENAERLLRLDGRQWYRTGDLCSRASDGQYHFIGRTDGEVKVRGYRFHLNEVHRSLSALPWVRDCVISVLDGGDRKILAAAVRPDPEVPEPDADALRKLLAGTLPEYMVPERWVFSREFPRLPSGKVDVRAVFDAGVHA